MLIPYLLFMNVCTCKYVSTNVCACIYLCTCMYVVEYVFLLGLFGEGPADRRERLRLIIADLGNPLIYPLIYPFIHTSIHPSIH